MRRNAKRGPYYRGIVQTGAARFILESADDVGINYRVEADVVPHWGLQPKPGAVWTFTRGRAPASEGIDAVRARALACYRGGSIYQFEGYRSEYPYQAQA